MEVRLWKGGRDSSSRSCDESAKYGLPVAVTICVFAREKTYQVSVVEVKAKECGPGEGSAALIDAACWRRFMAAGLAKGPDLGGECQEAQSSIASNGRVGCT